MTQDTLWTLLMQDDRNETDGKEPDLLPIQTEPVNVPPLLQKEKRFTTYLRYWALKSKQRTEIMELTYEWMDGATFLQEPDLPKSNVYRYTGTFATEAMLQGYVIYSPDHMLQLHIEV